MKSLANFLWQSSDDRYWEECFEWSDRSFLVQSDPDLMRVFWIFKIPALNQSRNKYDWQLDTVRVPKNSAALNQRVLIRGLTVIQCQIV